jgi:hypothetical protein
LEGAHEAVRQEVAWSLNRVGDERAIAALARAYHVEEEGTGDRGALARVCLEAILAIQARLLEVRLKERAPEREEMRNGANGA